MKFTEEKLEQADGFFKKREDRTKKDLFIQLIGYKNIENNMS